MTYYFKAGAYLQDNLGPPTEGGRVSFYQISATHLILPPTISAPPISQTVSPGAALTLTATATGTFPLFYQWRADGVAPAAWTNASLLLTNFQAGDQRNYEVIVSNAAGAVTSVPAALYLNAPLRFRNPRNTGGRFTALLLGAANSNYVLQTSSNLIAWTSVATNNSLSGIITLNRTNPPGRTRYYRARLK